MTRRSFLYFTAVLSASKLFGKVTKYLNISMNGDLDDDLIILKNKFSSFDFEVLDCFQMHNLAGKFNIGGTSCKSIQIPGYIEYNKNHTIEENEIISIFTANEREDRTNKKELMMRSHYKSTNLDINNVQFFPSVIPEKNDIPDYPTWYGIGENANYNYYQLWENAVVNTGLIFSASGEFEIILLDKENEIISHSKHYVSKKTTIVKFKTIRDVKTIFTHPFTETDGTIFKDGKKMDDKLIRKNAIYSIAIKNSIQELVIIPLPYPMPYINRIYTKTTGI